MSVHLTPREEEKQNQVNGGDNEHTKISPELGKIPWGYLLAVGLLTCVPGTLDGTKGIQRSKNRALPSRPFLGVKGLRGSKVERTFQGGGESRKKEKPLRI